MIRSVVRKFLYRRQIRDKSACVYHMQNGAQYRETRELMPNDRFRELKKRVNSKEWGWLHSPYDNNTLLSFLDRYADADTVSLCELGVGTGRTANRIVEYLHGLSVRRVNYFGVDDLSLLGSQPRFEYTEMQFINGNREAATCLPKLDFAFIDACHCAECVYRDALVLSRCVKVGGQLGFHDTAILGQYPMSAKSRTEGQRQHYGRAGESIRPLAVVEGIISSRPRWDGDWSLIIQDGDDLDWGGIRIYQKIA